MLNMLGSLLEWWWIIIGLAASLVCDCGRIAETTCGTLAGGVTMLDMPQFKWSRIPSVAIGLAQVSALFASLGMSFKLRETTRYDLLLLHPAFLA